MQKKLSITTAALAFVFLGLAQSISGCSKSSPTAASPAGPEMIKPAAPPAGFAHAGDDNAELVAVKVKAQAQLPEFKAAFAKRKADQNFAIKAPFREGPYEEHKWVIVDAVKKDEMDGHVEKPSQTIKHLKVGQIITVNDYNIEDWAYTDQSGQQHGGDSVAILRKQQEKAQGH